MYVFMHKKVTPEEKRNAIYKHLYEMNINQLVREQKVITDVWKEICWDTAAADVRNIVLCGNLENYYKRLMRNAV